MASVGLSSSEPYRACAAGREERASLHGRYVGVGMFNDDER